MKYLQILIISCLLSYSLFSQDVIFENDDLEIHQVSENIFLHKSFLETDDFGLVGCNGMIYLDNKEAVVFDTPINNSASTSLIKWIASKNLSIKAVIATHWHDDCTGGLGAFHNENIPSYGNRLTIELAEQNENPVPLNAFDSTLTLSLNNTKIITIFPGEGHTLDNVVSYVESEKALFGGCLIKSIGAGKGFTGDGNLETWSQSVNRIKSIFPDLKHVIPGHGSPGDAELLDFTMELFRP